MVGGNTLGFSAGFLFLSACAQGAIFLIATEPTTPETAMPLPSTSMAGG